MSVKELAIINKDEKNYEFSSNLDGVKYYIEFNYNDRNDTWYLNLKNENRDNILTGIACLTNVIGLIGRFVIDDVIEFGDIVISDTAEGKDDPSFENFGDYVSAFYASIVT